MAKSGQLKVSILGAECSGKSTLIKSLSTYFQAPFVTEVARQFVETNHRTIAFHDVKDLCDRYLFLEKQYTQASLLFYDTNLWTTEILSDYYFGKCPQQVRRQARLVCSDINFFTGIDIPWEDDPLQRSTAADRQKIHQCYAAYFRQHNIPHIKLHGSPQKRFEDARTVILNQLKNGNSPKKNRN